MKLHQLLAILQKVKSKTKKKQTEIYQIVQKSTLFNGLTKKYAPQDEDGYVYPGENKLIQYKAKDCINKFTQSSTELFDLCFQQDTTNQLAKANLQLGSVEISDVPVSYLLFLESQLQDIKTFINSLPVLDVGEEWTFDSNKGCYVTAAKGTAKTKKVTKPVVLYEATKEHPAQVKEASEDIVEGTWNTINLSAALPQQEKDKYLERVDGLIKQVILTREKANETEVTQVEIGEHLFNYIFS